MFYLDGDVEMVDCLFVCCEILFFFLFGDILIFFSYFVFISYWLVLVEEWWCLGILVLMVWVLIGIELFCWIREVIENVLVVLDD